MYTHQAFGTTDCGDARGIGALGAVRFFRLGLIGSIAGSPSLSTWAWLRTVRNGYPKRASVLLARAAQSHSTSVGTRPAPIESSPAEGLDKSLEHVEGNLNAGKPQVAQMLITRFCFIGGASDPSHIRLLLDSRGTLVIPFVRMGVSSARLTY